MEPDSPVAYDHLEYRERRRDGQVRWVEACGVAYFAGTGHERRVVSFGGTVQDVTESTGREEKEQLLMREINHRAKNILTRVCSVAYPTSTRKPAKFFERFPRRTHALSAHHRPLLPNT